MEYVFGTKGHLETLQTKGRTHTDLSGYQQTVRDYDGETITDNYRILQKVKSDEDSAGNCYDWYVIDRHYRLVDRTKTLEEANRKNAAMIDYIGMMLGVELPFGEEEDYGEEQEV